jgi:SsrA-binding protein
MPVLITNKKARFNFQILETFQAGLSLSGPMVKLVRAKAVNLEGVYIVYQKGSLQMIGFGTATMTENVPLLLTQKEINEILGSIQQKGVTCIPLTIKTVGRWLKADIAVVKGKSNADKRQSIKQRDVDRDIARDFGSLR